MINNSIRFSKELFDTDKIRDSILAYREIANILLTEQKDYYVCEFISTVYPLEITKMEFENYVIGCFRVNDN